MPPILSMASAANHRSTLVGRRYHFHAGGIGYAVTTVILVVGAVNSQNNLLFWLFGLGVAGLIVSGFLSGGALMRLSVEREIDTAARVGDEVVVRYRLHNRSRLYPAYAITIEELERSRGGNSDWKGRLSTAVAFAPYVPARGMAVVETRIRAGKRGVATFGPMRVLTTFPFGLTKKSVTFFQRDSVRVWPWVAPVKDGLLRSLSRAGEGGSTLRRARGGDEFYSLREFVPGDSLRSVAWRSTARAGHAVVREVAVRPSRRVWVVLCLDIDITENEQVISVGAALIEQASRLGMEAGVALGDGTVVEGPRPGRARPALWDRLALLGAGDGLGGSSSGGLANAARAGDASIIVCTTGGGPEAMAGVRVVVDDPAIYQGGLPAGLHPRYDFDMPAGPGPVRRTVDRLVQAWRQPGP